LHGRKTESVGGSLPKKQRLVPPPLNPSFQRVDNLAAQLRIG
jgi:hypothetical protein